jgi:hypothetical protein
MYSSSRLISIIAALSVTACVTTPKKDLGWESWSYLQSKGSKVDAKDALPKNDKEGEIFAKIAMRANPSADSTGLMQRSSAASKEVFKNMCAASSGRKLTANITVVLPGSPSGLPLEQAQSLRKQFETAAAAKVKDFFQNNYYTDKASYYLTADTVAKASKDLQYVCPIPASSFFMFVPKDNQFLFTFSPPRYDKESDQLFYYCADKVYYRPRESEKPRNVFLVPSGEAVSTDFQTCYAWAKPEGQKLQPSKKSYLA